jgi:two-component system alkaline phosphatase synthesis response regulator PhoP
MKGKRILIVDDEARVLLILQATLGVFGSEFELVTARDGEEALRQLRSKEFALVITDLRMPRLSGIELTEEIRGSSLCARVMWITAYGCEHVREQCKRLSVDGCLDKPLGIQEIRQAVAEILDTDYHGDGKNA